MCTPLCRNLPLEPVPSGTSLGGRKIQARILGQLHFQALHDMRFKPLSSCKSPVREHWTKVCLVWGKPLLCCLLIAGRKVQVSQAERSDAVVAQRPLSHKERTEARGDRERRGDFRK